MKRNIIQRVLFILGTYTSFLYGQCAKYEPADGSVLFIVGQDCNATGGTMYGGGYVDDVQLSALGSPAGITTYYSVSLTAGAGLNTLINYGAGPLQASQYIGNPNFTNSVIAIGLYMTDGFGNTLPLAFGGYNAQLDALSDWIKSIAPRPVYLRIGYEFETQYANNPSQYIQAYRYVVDRFRSQSVQNVAYVWQAAAGNGGTTYLLNWYPGDTYVDWLAYSHFEYDGNLFEGLDIIALARAKRKPVMIAEATPRGYNLANSSSATNAWNNYFNRLFARINANIDVIKALCYINQDWDAQSLWAGQGWGNSRIQANGNGTLEANWISELSKSHWVHASNTLFAHLNNAGQKPYSGNAAAIPGTIQAEHFDDGCLGDSYWDNTGGNSGNSILRYGYSTDLGTTADGGGGITLAYTSTGEWLEYTVNVTTPGIYTCTFRTATLNTGNSFHLEMDGTDISGPIQVPLTAGWETYTNLVVPLSYLSSGNHILRLYFDNAPGFNLNYFSFDTPAPIQLLRWYGIRKNSTTTALHWSTIAEINNDGFIVQKSLDGNTFSSIAFVEGKGDSNSLSEYVVEDGNAYEDVLYYKLLAISTQGDTIESEILKIATNSSVEIYPNPCVDLLHITSSEFPILLCVFNTEGIMVFSSKLENFHSTIHLPLPSGCYQAKVVSENEVQQFSLIIIN